MNIVTLRLRSRVMFMPMDVSVLLPETPVAEGEKLKVLWLLHGAAGDHRTFLYSANFNDYTRRHRCLIVLPAAHNSDYGNYEQFGTGYNFPAYFFDELMPFIYATFPASRKREDNYLLGASMGGYGAMSLGLAHPERFAALGMLGASLRESAFLAPYIDMDRAAFRALATAEPERFPTEYGVPGAIKLKEINVICRYPSVRAFLDSPECMYRRFPEVVAAGTLPDIYAACGTEDMFYAPTRRFQALTEELGVTDKVHFTYAEGVGHSGTYFNEEIGRFMDHFAL